VKSRSGLGLPVCGRVPTFPGTAYPPRHASVAESADALGLGPSGVHTLWGFKSPRSHERAIEGSVLHLLPDVGHEPQFPQPDAVAEAIDLAADRSR
jgi:pimeloyl-ACP methyl ester carboxylesterase